MISTLLLSLTGAAGLAWVYLFWRTRRSLAAALRPRSEVRPASTPLVSVLVPARNEADRALEAGRATGD